MARISREVFPALFFLAVGAGIGLQAEDAAFRRGDLNSDGIRSIDDVMLGLNHIFQGLPKTLDCNDSADVNDDGLVTAADSIDLLFYLFEGIDSPPEPWNSCGVDPTADFLTCNSYLPCGEPSIYQNFLGMNMVFIHAGAFAMGSPDTERGRNSDEQLHDVLLTCDFYIGETEVTQGQYVEIMGVNPSYFNGRRDFTDYGTDLNRPVESVTWFDALNFCKKLSEREGRSYRLPTEAEWEYTCRAGTTTRFWFGDALGCIDGPFCSPPCSEFKEFTWGCDTYSLQSMKEVEKKKPNLWGIYDLHTGVTEWCQDWYGPYPSKPMTDPTGPSMGTSRVCRDDLRANGTLRSAARAWGEPKGWGINTGLRVVLQICEPTGD